MIDAGAVRGIAILAGIGGLLVALALYVAGRRRTSPPQKKAKERREPETDHGSFAGPTTRLTWTPPVTGAAPLYSNITMWQAPATRGPTGYTSAATVRQPQVTWTPIVIKPIDRPYWDIQHWQLHGDRLDGFYRTPFGSHQGYVLCAKGPRPQFYIVDPPDCLKHHSHWICFHPAGVGTYSVHLNPAPENADAGILAIEKVLGEALAGKGRRND